jgi:hypothetical protein
MPFFWKVAASLPGLLSVDHKGRYYPLKGMRGTRHTPRMSGTL